MEFVKHNINAKWALQRTLAFIYQVEILYLEIVYFHYRYHYKMLLKKHDYKAICLSCEVIESLALEYLNVNGNGILCNAHSDSVHEY